MVNRVRERWPVADASSKFTVEIDVYFPDERPRDVDNVAKSVLDGLNRNVWKDDRQVTRLVVNRHVNRAMPRTEVTIERIARPEQLPLTTRRP